MRRAKITLRAATSALAAFIFTAPLPAATGGSITFHKDVEPILQKHCQTCHRPGQIAPMSFLTYNTARPWAKAMKAAVLSRKMPPWFADPNSGHFSNNPSLNPQQIAVIANWADTAAAEGKQEDAPRAINWPDGWIIQPDLVIEGPTTNIPANIKNNVIEWITVVVPTGLTKDTWVTSVEIKPDHPEATHHICVGFAPHKEGARYFEPVWIDKPRDEDGSALPSGGRTFTNGGNIDAREDCYLPGAPAIDYRNFKAGKLLRAGSDITLSLHYVPVGKDISNHVRIGFTVAKVAPARRYVSLSAGSRTDANSFSIPPNDPNWKSPPGEVEFLQDAELVIMTPHMHARGKDMTYTLKYPDGRSEVILSVSKYDFNWQLGYETSIRVPAGSKLHVEAHFDNSANNKSNPNPNKTVFYGEMTWEEMMLPFFGVVVDQNADSGEIIKSGAGSGQ